MTRALDIVGLLPKTGHPVPGLVPVTGVTRLDRIDEQAARVQAAAIGDIDYIFFRRFSDGRSSQVAAYVIDNSEDRLTEREIGEIHKKLWLNGSAPLLYVGWQTRVDILSCARGPDFWHADGVSRYNPAEKLDLAGQVSDALNQRRARFSAFRLADGTFWDNPENADLAQVDKAAHRRLINAVVETDVELAGEKNPLLRRLLLLTILIKYLEDRGVFPDGWFNQNHKGANSFFDVLQQGTPDEVRGLLGKLERKFNGDVFSLPEDATHYLTATKLRRFAELIEAKTLREQRYLWEQFSFRYIPVEVLSHLYQRFAQRDKGAVFTPPFLASLMLDYVLPYKGMRGDEKIFDPTCGSGVFLVGAFRRLIHFWKSQNNWKQPDVSILKGILKTSIHGVELQAEAVHLAAFSLALALCDALQPNVIWKDLRFDKLAGSNLLEGDFFDCLDQLGNERFDVIVGNPPFMSKFSDAAQRVNRSTELKRVPVPDKQMAYLIAEKTLQLLKANGHLCLLQPSGFLYNEKTRAFQKSYIASNQVDAILDFTSIRNLYDGADPKTVALVVTKRSPKQSHIIRHCTFRRTFSVQERIGFELDHYDRHKVSQSDGLKHSWIWRVNLLGGGRLVQFTERIAGMPTLRSFVEGKGWDYGEGFVCANKGRRQKAPWLTGKPFLPTRAFSEKGIDQSQIGAVKETEFRSEYTESRYSAPIVLIKEVDTLPCVFREEGFLAYRHQIVGIHAPEKEIKELNRFYKDFVTNRDVLRASCALLGGRALSGKATSILKRDIDVLPWPQSGAWDLSIWEKILCEDLVSLTSEFIRLGQNSKLLQCVVKPDDLAAYSGIFVEMLGSVYSNLTISKFLIFDGIACQAFCFGKAPEIDLLQSADSLRKLIYVECGEALRTIRVLRYYDQNVILVVKPDRLRYWIRSTAIRDADETLVDLMKQGF